MKAAFLVGPRQFELRETVDPVAPVDGLVLRVRACGVCGSDLRRWKEGPPIGAGDITPGHEIAGEVLSVGSRLSGYAVGDPLAVAPDVHCERCYYCRRAQYNLCDDLRFIGITPGYGGGFAERLVLTAEILANGCVHHMPAGLSFAEGALAEPCSSVLACHDAACTSLGDTVLVMGGGPIGCLHVAIARARGARVIVSEPGKGRRQLAQGIGAEAVIDPVNEDVVRRARELTGRVGADLVICANPAAASQTQAVQAVRKGGRVVLFGGLPKANPMTTLDGNRIHYGEITVVGAFSYHPRYHEAALQLLARKAIPNSVATHVLALDDIDDAFATADTGVDALKVIVTPQGLEG